MKKIIFGFSVTALTLLSICHASTNFESCSTQAYLASNKQLLIKSRQLDYNPDGGIIASLKIGHCQLSEKMNGEDLSITVKSNNVTLHSEFDIKYNNDPDGPVFKNAQNKAIDSLINALENCACSQL